MYFYILISVTRAVSTSQMLYCKADNQFSVWRPFSYFIQYSNDVANVYDYFKWIKGIVNIKKICIVISSISVDVSSIAVFIRNVNT